MNVGEHQMAANGALIIFRHHQWSGV